MTQEFTLSEDAAWWFRRIVAGKHPRVTSADDRDALAELRRRELIDKDSRLSYEGKKYLANMGLK